MSTRCFLGLGSNIGDRIEYLKRAIQYLHGSDGITCVATSKLYETEPVGFTEQDYFFNIVVAVDTNLGPYALLQLVLQIEKQLGRERLIRWGPRTIDIDILTYGNVQIESEQLVIPHPRLHERAFVLRPLLDLDEAFIHPKFHVTLRSLWEQLVQKEGIIECMTQWENEFARIVN